MPCGIIPEIPVTDIRRTLEIGGVAASNVDPHEATKPLLEKALADFDRNL